MYFELKTSVRGKELEVAQGFLNLKKLLDKGSDLINERVQLSGRDSGAREGVVEHWFGRHQLVRRMVLVGCDQRHRRSAPQESRRRHRPGFERQRVGMGAFFGMKSSSPVYAGLPAETLTKGREYHAGAKYSAQRDRYSRIFLTDEHASSDSPRTASNTSSRAGMRCASSLPSRSMNLCVDKADHG